MKLAGARAAAFLARPEARGPKAPRAILLYGPDATLVALRRRALVAGLTEGDDLRLTRLDGAAAARAPVEIDSALRARGFFPGRRVVLVEGAGDALARPLAGILQETLADLAPEEAVLLVTAGQLGARSGLRRLFEGATQAVAIGLYPDPPDAAELEGLLADAGLGGALTADAAAALAEAARKMDRGALMQLIETVGLYALGAEGPVDAAELAGLMPEAADGELDRLLAAVAAGRADAVGPLMRRLSAAGVGPAAMLIAAGRHFRLLLGLVSDADGLEAALGRLRPPAFGPRRQALAAQARQWEAARLEAGLRLLFQADRRLRSPGDRPDRAMVERCLIRLTMMAARRAG